MRGFYVIIGACALFFETPVTGLSFSSTPDSFVIGGSGTLTMACSLTESGVKQVYVIKIKRAKTPGSITDEDIASITSGLDAPALGEDITDDKGFEVTGNLNGVSSKLELSMDISKLTCSDARVYKCEVGYDSSATGKIETVEHNITLQAFVLPQVLPPLQAKRNGNFIEGGTLSDKARFDVGDELELQCRANIGSIDSVTIRWRKMSEMDDSQFIGYQPQEGSYDDGSPLSDNQCGYTRTATIRYNVTSPVSGYDPAFECYVSVSGYPSSTLTPSGSYTTNNNLRYYIDVTSSNTKSSSSVSNAGSGNAGAIAGGVVGGLVLIVLIVLLVYFLWYRRRSSGEDYTTKEEYGSENPNMAPPLDTYATVDKKKKTSHPEQENGSNEPLKPQPKPRRAQQELHYAELDLTKNPPVAPRKSRGDPVEYAEVQFHK